MDHKISPVEPDFYVPNWKVCKTEINNERNWQIFVCKDE
jgi:hypothetical protein